MAEKMTRKDMFVYIMDHSDNPMIVEFCQKEVDKLSKPRKRSVNQEAIAYAERVFDIISMQDLPMTAKQIGNETGVSTQKASAALRRLVQQGRVMRIEGEKKSDAARYTLDYSDVAAD